MNVDVSKAAVDARVVAREAKRVDARRIGLALVVIAAVLVGIRLYEGAWLPIGWSILFALVALGFAAGRSQKSNPS